MKKKSKRWIEYSAVQNESVIHLFDFFFYCYHKVRHSFGTHLLADGYDIRTVQELLEYKDVKTMMIYAHVLNRGGKGVRSPADTL